MHTPHKIMHYFKYKSKDLFCEGVRVEDIARRFGTPVYVYSYRTLIEHFRKIQRAFSSLNPLICFSMKSNSNLAICKALADEGAGLDVVSGGELYRAKKVGVDGRKIVYASVGKTEQEIKDAIRANILFFNVESVPELNAINNICRSMGRRVNVSFRINPDVDALTHRYITTGKKATKFGIDMETAYQLYRSSQRYPNVNMIGLHLHIGSQITGPEPFVRALKKVARLVKKLRAADVELIYLNIGGGLGIIYDQEVPQSAAKFAKAVVPILKQIGLEVILEPGRFIVGNAGILVTRIICVKESFHKRFVIVDSGMNDLLRPSLYGAYHEIVPLRKSRVTGHGSQVKADVVGPICESGDFLAKDRELFGVNSSDYLAVMSTGAYGFTMASNYNSRPRPAEVMVKGDKYCLVRKRESYRDLIRGECFSF